MCTSKHEYKIGRWTPKYLYLPSDWSESSSSNQVDLVIGERQPPHEAHAAEGVGIQTGQLVSVLLEDENITTKSYQSFRESLAANKYNQTRLKWTARDQPVYYRDSL